MKDTFINKLEVGQTLDSVFLLTKCQPLQSKNGKWRTSVTLRDRTGVVDGVWFDEAVTDLAVDDIVRVCGSVGSYNDEPQINISEMFAVPDDEADLADLLPATKRDTDEMLSDVMHAVASISSEPLRTLLTGLLDPKLQALLMEAPAAKSMHHAFRGGLLEHVWNLIRLAAAVDTAYSVGGYTLDHDLLVAGCILHDIGKVYELSFRRSISYSVPGSLLGHVDIGMGMVTKAIDKAPGFPLDLRLRLLHIIASHHGTKEHGAHVVPATREAIVFHQLDALDSRMGGLDLLLEQDHNTGPFTYYSAMFETAIYKGDTIASAPVTEPQGVTAAHAD